MTSPEFRKSQKHTTSRGKSADTDVIRDLAKAMKEELAEKGTYSINTDQIYPRCIIDKVIDYLKKKYVINVGAMYNVRDRKSKKTKLWAVTTPLTILKKGNLITLGSTFGMDFASPEDASAFLEQLNKIPIEVDKMIYGGDNPDFNRKQSIETAKQVIGTPVKETR